MHQRLRQNAQNCCHCRLVVKVYREECVVPENIHIHHMEGCLKFREGGTFKTKIVNPLSPSIHIQILQTDLHTFPLKIS